jgi:hypothetical protein
MIRAGILPQSQTRTVPLCSRFTTPMTLLLPPYKHGVGVDVDAVLRYHHEARPHRVSGHGRTLCHCVRTGVMKRCGLDRHASIPDRPNRFISSPQRPHKFWGLSSLLFSEYRALSPRVRQPALEADCLPSQYVLSDFVFTLLY